MKKPLGIYIHIPFCVRKCKYCDFLSGPADEKTQKAYVKMLLKEIEQYSDLLEERQTDTIFFGGGTPSVLPGEEIVRIMEKLRSFGNVSEHAEISIEANPGTVTEEKLLHQYNSHNTERLDIEGTIAKMKTTDYIKEELAKLEK